jgi:hypothetical protein
VRTSWLGHAAQSAAPCVQRVRTVSVRDSHKGSSHNRAMATELTKNKGRQKKSFSSRRLVSRPSIASRIILFVVIDFQSNRRTSIRFRGKRSAFARRLGAGLAPRIRLPKMISRDLVLIAGDQAGPLRLRATPLGLGAGNGPVAPQVRWPEMKERSDFTDEMSRHRIYSRSRPGASIVGNGSLSVADVVIRGQAATKSEAVAEAERAIDRALAPKRLRLVRREDRD